MSKTIAEFNKKFGYDIKGNPKMKISTWLKRHGQPNLAKLLAKIEKKHD